MLAPVHRCLEAVTDRRRTIERHISLHVPTDAQVWFEGKATTQTGTVRQYHSPELTPGKKYHYEVRVRWMKDGKPVEEKRRIEVEAKDWLRFDLTQPSDR